MHQKGMGGGLVAEPLVRFQSIQWTFLLKNNTPTLLLPFLYILMAGDRGKGPIATLKSTG